jgi:hypothetical protein
VSRFGHCVIVAIVGQEEAVKMPHEKHQYTYHPT